MARKASLKPLADTLDSAKAAVTDLVDGNAKLLAGKLAVELSIAKHAGFSPRQIANALKAKGIAVTETDIKKAYEIVDKNTIYSPETTTVKK